MATFWQLTQSPLYQWRHFQQMDFLDKFTHLLTLCGRIGTFPFALPLCPLQLLLMLVATNCLLCKNATSRVNLVQKIVVLKMFQNIFMRPKDSFSNLYSKGLSYQILWCLCTNWILKILKTSYMFIHDDIKLRFVLFYNILHLFFNRQVRVGTVPYIPQVPVPYTINCKYEKIGK